MIVDKEFLRAAREAFSPFSPYSGTEHVAPLLYSLVRLTRPRVVVECGSGYTTLFLLVALAENSAEMREEAELLREKTTALRDLNKLNFTSEDPAFIEWYGKGVKACGADPAYYLNMCAQRLYSFEEREADHEYTRRMRKAVEDLNLSDWLTYLNGAGPSPDALPPEAFPIDFAWNDAHQYKEFFEAFWPALNPKGGIMVFHNTVARKYSWDAIQWMKAKRALANDLEVMTLPEIHKLDQNSCTILRRTTKYQPQCLTRSPEEIVNNAVRFMQKIG